MLDQMFVSVKRYTIYFMYTILLKDLFEISFCYYFFYGCFYEWDKKIMYMFVLGCKIEKDRIAEIDGWRVNKDQFLVVGMYTV